MDESLDVRGLKIDYNFLGTYPKNINELNGDEIIDVLVESYKYSLTRTVFTFYGNNLLEIKDLISQNIYSKEYNYKDLSNKKKWDFTILIILRLFFEIHDVIFSISVIDEILDKLETLSEDETKIILNDLNFSLFFAVKEFLSVKPSSVRILCSSEDGHLYSELLDLKESLESIIKNNIKIKKVKEDLYISFFKEPLDEKYCTNLYDVLVETLLKFLSTPKELLNNNTEKKWGDYSADIYSIIFIFFSTFIESDKGMEEAVDLIYYEVMRVIKDKYKIEYPIATIELY